MQDVQQFCVKREGLLQYFDFHQVLLHFFKPNNSHGRETNNFHDNQFICTKCNVIQREFPTPPCKSARPSPNNNLDEKQFFFPRNHPVGHVEISCRVQFYLLCELCDQ